MLRFPYLHEPLLGSPPPSMSSSAQVRWRPLVPITLHGPQGFLSIGRALIDCGADDTVFAMDIAGLLNIPLQSPTTHTLRWRGQRYGLSYGTVDLELTDDDGNALRWPAVVAFTAANLRYPLLGMCGCLEFFDTRLLGDKRQIELEPNPSFPRARP